MEIVLSPKAQSRLDEYVQYLYQQTQSNSFVTKYLGEIEENFEKVLSLFPESGTPMPEYGEGIRRLSFQGSAILYRIEQNRIEVLTFYRQNQP